MMAGNDRLKTLRSFDPAPGQHGSYHSLPVLEEKGFGAISRLPVCLRVILESLVRNLDGKRVHEADVQRLAAWKPSSQREAEIPFLVARILLQDFTGVPVLVDLAALRSAAVRLGRDPMQIEPLVPVDLVVDHSVQVDFWRGEDALARNMEIEMRRNQTRYQFLKWGTSAFRGFNVVPPGIGICHQLNLEYLARGVFVRDGVYFPDTLVGADSHTTMINGLGVLGWGVGGIEAEAAMLGQPVYLREPDVVGVHLHGAIAPGVTATDVVLHVTEILRRQRVVGKLVEFFGEGTAALTVPDRATIANMAPEYGATCGYFPPDEQACRYLQNTGRDPELVAAFRSYYTAQGMFGVPRAGDIDYTSVVEVDLRAINPCVAGPRRPQDRLALGDVAEDFRQRLAATSALGGYGKQGDEARRAIVRIGESHVNLPMAGGGQQAPETAPVEEAPATSDADTNPLTEREMMQNRPTPDRVQQLPDGESPATRTSLRHGDIVLAAITSCTNTSNPSVMFAAGLLARNAVQRGLTVKGSVKTSLSPGSRVVAEYLHRAGLQSYLDRLGFRVTAFGCASCIGNAGPLDPAIDQAVNNHDLIVAAVLSGNRNFEARVHQSVRANYLMSPPLVVAFAIAGRIDIDLNTEPLGQGDDGQDIYLRDIWPTARDLAEAMAHSSSPEDYQRAYGNVAHRNPHWAEIPTSGEAVYPWNPSSTYIQEPPYFDRFSLEPAPVVSVLNARALAIFGDSITTDHISPAGAIPVKSSAGEYLREHGVPPEDFNSYGSRRGNDRVMVRGTFANVRLRNKMVPGSEGAVTAHQPSGDRLSIYEASLRYQAARVPLLVFAGLDYGSGSSRDWAAKGTALLGVRAVITRSFERIHRANLVQTGVLPCQFQEGDGPESLGLDGTEIFDLERAEELAAPGGTVTLVIRRPEREAVRVPLIARLDTPIELEYYRHGGILPYMLRQLLKQSPEVHI